MKSNLRDKKFLLSVATLVGSTVGVGFYGIPFTFVKAGFGMGLAFFVGVVGLVWLTNLLFGEVVLRTHQRHQMVGYVNKYLGPWAKWVNLFIFWVSIYGAMIGIIIISGDFLSNILSVYFTLSSATFSTIFILVASILVIAGLKTISKIDLVVMGMFFAVVVLIAVMSIKHIALANYDFAITDFWFLPFGVILFSMNNSSGVPLMREILVGSERKLKSAISWGTLIPAGLYLAFTAVVVGVSGEITSTNAMSGLQEFLGTKIVVIGSILGFITSTNIFFNIATSMRESLEQDFKMKKRWLWVLALLPPYLLFLSGIRNFIDIIDLVGGVAVSLHTVLLIRLYIQAKKNGERIPEYAMRIPTLALYAMMAVFSLGAVYTIFVK